MTELPPPLRQRQRQWLRDTRPVAMSPPRPAATTALRATLQAIDNAGGPAGPR